MTSLLDGLKRCLPRKARETLSYARAVGTSLAGKSHPSTRVYVALSNLGSPTERSAWRCFEPPIQKPDDPPRTIERAVHANFRSKVFPLHATFVASLEGAKVKGAGGCVYSKRDRPVSDLMAYRDFCDLLGDPFPHRSEAPATRRLAGNTALLATPWAERCYYHWLLELLPRFGLLEMSGYRLDEVDWFLINEVRHRFQEETLNKIGIPADKIIYTNADTHIQAEMLIVPTVPRLSHNRLVGDFLQNLFPAEAAPPRRRRLYISRAKSAHRRVEKEDELFWVLERRGFERLYLEDLAVHQQAQAMAAAEAVIAPHGAGLANLVFCDKGTKVIELLSPRYVCPVFWELSNARELEYYYLLGEGQRIDRLRPWNNNADLRVDLDKLKRTLDLAGV